MLFSNFGKKNYFVEEDFIELKDSVKETNYEKSKTF